MVDVLSVLALVAVAFAGGALGAAVGGLPALALSGVVVVVGEAATLAARLAARAGPGDAAGLGATGLTATIGLGPALGPHVAFAGGVAAAAYAARTGRLDTGSAYHQAKSVAVPVGTAPDVLLVGGSFGVLGLLVASLSAGAFAGTNLPWPALPWDPVMFAVLLSGLCHRIALGYPLVGTVRGGLLDMSPFERGERRRPPGDDGDGPARLDGGAAPSTAHAGDTEDNSVERFVVEPWLPHQYEWAAVGALGAVVGVFAAFVTYRTGSPVLAFGIAAASLLLAGAGRDRVPVTHHMAFPASAAVVALAGGATTPETIAGAVPLALAVVAGAAFGAFAGLAGELAQRALYAHADTHLDPPAAAIVVSTLVLSVLSAVGVLAPGAVPTLGG